MKRLNTKHEGPKEKWFVIPKRFAEIKTIVETFANQLPEESKKSIETTEIWEFLEKKYEKRDHDFMERCAIDYKLFKWEVEKELRKEIEKEIYAKMKNVLEEGASRMIKEFISIARSGVEEEEKKGQ